MNWYELSYSAFLNQPTKTKEDLIRIIAFAYSWMPTIPDINSENTKWDRLIELINELKQGSIVNRKELLSLLTPLVNNSIVGSSKVLHFIAPNLAPIIDGRVTKAWNKRFGLGKTGYEFKRPNSYFFKEESGMNKVIEVYLKYWDVMQWQVVEFHKTLRELEFEMYSEGKSQ